MQHAINAKADHTLLTARLQMDVTGALVKRVLPQPVHHLNHALVVGIELLVGFAQFHQLFKAGTATVAPSLAGRPHRLGQGKKLRRVAVNVLRACQHAAHPAAGLALHLGHPVGNVGLSRCHHQFGGQYLHRQNLVALGIRSAHGVGHLAHIHLERIDAQVIHG